MNFAEKHHRQTTFKVLSNVLLPLLLISSLNAQISSVSPPQNALHIPATTSIKVNFNQDMNAGTINNSTFRVWAMQSGPHIGVISYNVALKEVMFVPSKPFVAGEIVYFTLTNGITTQSGQPLNKFTGQFTIAVKASSGWFVAKTSYNTGNKPQALCGADFDKDGDIDLAVANEMDDFVVMMKNKGDGIFQLATPYVLGSAPRDLVAADFDGDGYMNIAVVMTGNDSVVVLKNNSDGTWQNQARYPATARPQSLFAADMDSDGDVDLLAPSVRDFVAVLINNGSGAFTDRLQLKPSTSEILPRHAFAADLDNDGDVDFLVSRVHGNGTIMKNDNGIFQNLGDVHIGGSPTALFFADLDGDGDNDLSTSNSNGIYILKNNGSAGFSGDSAPQTGQAPSSFFAADLDGDGDVDLPVTNLQSHSVSILKNNGNGTFQTKRDYAAGKNPNDIFAADFDGDGDVDLATADYGSNTVTILANRGLVLANPVALNFGQAYFGYPKDLNFTVYNLTKSGIQVSGITSTNPQFAIIGSTNFSVGAGDSVVVNVRYAPAAAVSDAGTFTVAFAGFPSENIVVSGAGIPPAAIIGVTPATLNFGNVPLTKTADLIIDVSNSGVLDLNVAHIGASNPNFSVSGGSAFTLHAKETRSLAVRFATSALGSQIDTLKVLSNDFTNNPVKISLSAVGVTSQLPEISVQPLQLQFAEVEVKQTKTLTLKIYNRGSANLAISKINSNNARFIITAATKTMVLPDDSSTVSIQFSPLVAGLQTGTLTITSNDVNEKALGLRLSGFGKSAPTGNNPVPLLTAKLTPANGKRLQTFDVGFKGANFIAGVSSINTGPNITVNRVTVHRPDSLTANLTIAANAATGVRNFSVSNSPPGGGISGNRQFWVNNPTPTLVSLAPSIGLPGQTLSVTLTGTKFISGVTTVNVGAGIIVNSTTVNNSTSMTVKMTIVANAAGGPRNFSATNAGPGGGTSASQSFMVKPAPTLISIAPLVGKRGQTLNVNFKGTNFVSGVTSINVGAGIIVNSTNVTSASSLTANLTISATAGAGPRPFSVTNAGLDGGTSGSLNFTVENPLPTLTSITPNSGMRLQNLNVGFKGTNFFNGATKIHIGRHNVIVHSVTVHRIDSLTANITIEADATLGVRKFFVVNNPPGGGISNGQTFTVNAPAPALLFPAHSQVVQLSKLAQPLKFVWRQSLDRDEADSLKYVFTLQGAGFDTTVVATKDTSLSLHIMPRLKADSEYSWSLKIFDGAIAATAPERATFRTSSTITSVQEDNKLIPSEFILEQNYPNPFALAAKSAETTIKYQLPQTSFVTLKVFDMLGREMIALVNAQQAPGYYNVTWNGRNTAGQLVPGGIYICRLQAGSFERVMKMMLVR